MLALALVATACGSHGDPTPPAGSGSAAPAPTPAPSKPAPPPPPVDAAPPVAPADAGATNYFESELCLHVMTRLAACETDKAFITELDAHASAADRKRNAQLRADVHRDLLNLHEPRERCDFAGRVSFQHEGFLDHWPVIEAAIAKDGDALTSCAALGAAIRSAGGLPGGPIAD